MPVKNLIDLEIEAINKRILTKDLIKKYLISSKIYWICTDSVSLALDNNKWSVIQLGDDCDINVFTYKTKELDTAIDKFIELASEEEFKNDDGILYEQTDLCRK